MRNINIFIILLTILLTLGGCHRVQDQSSAQEPVTSLTIYNISSSDGMPSGYSSNSVITVTWDSFLSEDDLYPAEETTIVSFNGEKYEGSFLNSMYLPGNDHRSDYYICDKIVFSINSKNGNLEEISFPSNKEAKNSITAGEAKKIAEDIASQYINVDEYNLDIEGISSSAAAAEPYEYVFLYQRYIDNIKCWDAVQLYVLSSGSVSMFCNYMTSEFQEYINAETEILYQEIKKLDSDTVEREIIQETEKLSLYPDSIEDIDVFDKELVLLPDQRLGIIYKVKTLYQDNVYEMLHWFLVTE